MHRAPEKVGNWLGIWCSCVYCQSAYLYPLILGYLCFQALPLSVSSCVYKILVIGKHLWGVSQSSQSYWEGESWLCYTSGINVVVKFTEHFSPSGHNMFLYLTHPYHSNTKPTYSCLSSNKSSSERGAFTVSVWLSDSWADNCWGEPSLSYSETFKCLTT